MKFLKHEKYWKSLICTFNFAQDLLDSRFMRSFEFNAIKRETRESWSSKFDEIVFQKKIHCPPNLEGRIISVYTAYYSNRFLSSTSDRIVATGPVYDSNKLRETDTARRWPFVLSCTCVSSSIDAIYTPLLFVSLYTRQPS